MKFNNIFTLNRLRQSLVGISLTKRELKYLLLYLTGVIIGTIVIHEAAHVLAAVALGVPFAEIELGLYGINPSVTLPERFTGTPLTVFHYAGGLTAAVILLSVYLFYWLRRYRRKPSFLNWSMGLATILFVSMQLAQGYLEGRFHAAYIFFAGSLFNPLYVLLYAWAISATFIHFSLCRISKMKKERT